MAPAPLVYTLWNRVLRFDPEDPIWPDRDRFVHSNGKDLHPSSPCRTAPATNATPADRLGSDARQKSPELIGPSLLGGGPCSGHLGPKREEFLSFSRGQLVRSPRVRTRAMSGSSRRRLSASQRPARLAVGSASKAR